MRFIRHQPFPRAAWLALLLMFTGLAPAGETNGPPRDRDNADKHREEWKKLTPAEREAKQKEWDKRREDWNKLTPEEREAKRREIKERFEKRLSELRSKQTNNTLSTNELRELDRREQLRKRFEQADQAPRAKSSEPPAPDKGGVK